MCVGVGSVDVVPSPKSQYQHVAFFVPPEAITMVGLPKVTCVGVNSATVTYSGTVPYTVRLRDIVSLPPEFVAISVMVLAPSVE